jgi:CBS-domain-containing membrane protein
MKTPPPTLAGEAVPLVRLRVRALRHVGHDGDLRASSTVFCPGQCRSIDVETCRRCPRLSRAVDDTIECAPPKSERVARDLLADARLGDDACVGDAMGPVAVSVHAELRAVALTSALQEEGAVVAIVVDEDGHLLGLVGAADAVRAIESVRARELAHRVTPVHESAPLAHAVDRMVRERARALPVVDNDGYVVALLTDLDALHWVARRGGSR